MLVFIIALLSFLLDQIVKFIVVATLKGQRPYELIENFIYFHYVENRGAAFGILQNRKILFIIFTIIVVTGIILFLLKNYKRINNFIKISLGLLLGGAFGNFIDRIRLDYVVDFVSIKFFNKYQFAVFNLADVFIVLSTFMLVIYILFMSGNKSEKI
ncbi:MAG: signal peptidase II [Tissierellia bacterium]|nr:signal peptidase II [Tissierellia bacterium]